MAGQKWISPRPEARRLGRRNNEEKTLMMQDVVEKAAGDECAFTGRASG